MSWKITSNYSTTNYFTYFKKIINIHAELLTLKKKKGSGYYECAQKGC